ncbi:MAG TPA: hypothetical protein VD886_20470 [Herpetosiphonaceae bacterium]|nr:hypothetical protein [Herpetosiphonaceae bacterium]
MTTEHRGDGHLRRLAVVLTDTIGEADCQRCLDQLERYIDHQLAGRDYRGLLPAVAQHLDQCVRCAEDYALVYDVRRADADSAQGVPALPASIPAPNLDFLARPATHGASAARLDQQNALRAALAADGARLTVTLSPALLAALPAPAARPMALRSVDAPPLLTIAFEQPTPQIATLHLSAHRHPPASETLLLRVQVALHNREWPDLAGIPVRLSLGSEQRESDTDAWGEAVFSDIPQDRLGDLSVTVEG